MTIYSAYVGDSSEVFPKVLELWVPPGSSVLDMTFGKGVFWKKVPAVFFPEMHPETDKKYWRVAANDIDPKSSAYYHCDCRDFSPIPLFCPHMFDAVVFDPPWGCFSTTPRKDAVATNYKNPAWGSVQKFLLFCSDTHTEARRLLKPGGIYIVKCQDGTNSGKKHWMTWEIMRDYHCMGLVPVDQIIQVQKTDPFPPHGKQKHARMKHSVYWVFEKR